MKASPKASRMFTVAESVLENQGDAIWEVICDNLPLDKGFSTRQAAESVAQHFGLSIITALEYTRAVLQTVHDQGAGAVQRVGNRWML